MSEKPILFSAPMIRAILEGRKTQTRRIIKPSWARCLDPDEDDDRESIRVGCPYGQRGDRLWVRETFYCDNFTANDFAAARVGHVTPRTDAEIIAEWQESLYYRADTASGIGSCCELIPECMCAEYKTASGRTRSPWKPGIHMPRWASRITLEVTGVRVERLHDISEEDAKAEGVTFGEVADYTINGEPGRAAIFNARDAFAYLWAGINGADSWKANPWVWCVSFRRVEAQERAA